MKVVGFCPDCTHPLGSCRCIGCEACGMFDEHLQGLLEDKWIEEGR